MRLVHALSAVMFLGATAPAFATPCADEITTLEKRLDSAGAEKVAGKGADGAPAAHSDKALPTPPAGKPSDPSVTPTASGVKAARDLVEKARAEDKAGNADACRDSILKAKEKAGALP